MFLTYFFPNKQMSNTLKLQIIGGFILFGIVVGVLQGMGQTALEALAADHTDATLRELQAEKEMKAAEIRLLDAKADKAAAEAQMQELSF